MPVCSTGVFRTRSLVLCFEACEDQAGDQHDNTWLGAVLKQTLKQTLRQKGMAKEVLDGLVEHA